VIEFFFFEGRNVIEYLLSTNIKRKLNIILGKKKYKHVICICSTKLKSPNHLKKSLGLPLFQFYYKKITSVIFNYLFKILEKIILSKISFLTQIKSY